MMAAIYARTAAGGRPAIDEQIRHARAYADAHCYDVPEDLVFVDENVSGMTMAGNGLASLLERIEQGPLPISAVIVRDVDRLGRDFFELPQLLHRLRSLGVMVRQYSRPESKYLLLNFSRKQEPRS